MRRNWIFILVLIVLLLSYAAFVIGSVIVAAGTSETISDFLQVISPILPTFYGPLQLVIVIVVFSWIAERLGLGSSLKRVDIEWDIQSVLGVIVISAFSFAALSGIERGAELLKDLALVVVGFYFGTQRKVTEINRQAGTIRIVEEHENQPITEPSEEINEEQEANGEDSSNSNS